MSGEEAIRAAAAAAEEPPAPPSDRELADLPRNDTGNGERLRRRYGDQLVVTGDEAREWLTWDGKRYARDGGYTRALRLARETASAIRLEADAMGRDEAPPKPDNDDDLAKWKEQRARHQGRVQAHYKFGVSSGNVARLNAMLSLGAVDLRRSVREFDADPFRLNLQNGTLDLEARPDADGRVRFATRPWARGDLITRVCDVAYDPEAACPHWDAMLATVLPDPEVRRFLQVFAGYMITGDTSEQSLLLCYGTGANGKSTVLKILAQMLGDYAVTLNIKSFMHDDRKRAGDATPDLARLPGARLVTASEPEKGDRFSESLVKSITGGEALPVRQLFKEQYEIDPQFKVVLSANFKPSVRGADNGIWRRIKLLPFLKTIPDGERIPPRLLMARLRAELPGILNWALDGFLVWREEGLRMPDAVSRATEAYRRESDPIGEFMEACTERAVGSNVTAKRLFDTYCAWCKDNGIDHVTATSFGLNLADKGYRKERVGNVFYIGLAVTWSPPSADSSGQSGARSGDSVPEAEPF